MGLRKANLHGFAAVAEFDRLTRLKSTPALHGVRCRFPTFNEGSTMDTVLVDAYCSMVLRHHCTTDDILCDPDRRTEFLSECRRALGAEKAECDLLKRLSNLRKRCKLPRSRDVLAA